MVESVIEIKSGIMINVDVSAKKHYICEKDYIWNPVTCNCKNGKYLASIIDNSVITCDEIINAEAKSYNEKTKTIPRNIICETKSFCILIAFLLVIIAFLIAFVFTFA